ncbi:hypothetical protein HPB51_001810 [Rhipicephalus microplus]|uniref:Nose resistant-to-fluoxetine protein N-terminal domain-containing protein n=1 Tax=Rhipicephalus microplus TaxID=6941 RepID=A0A9J6EW22_RHIMP|nr:hypothetical protein HPB51_001810 [Rhipicephalus microplus]
MNYVVLSGFLFLFVGNSVSQRLTDTFGINRLVSAATNTGTAKDVQLDVDYLSVLRSAMSRGFASIPASVKFKLFRADVSPECKVGLLRTLRGFLKLEPWTIRLFDASAIYPTGLLQVSRANMGAFDECLETVVHDKSGNLITQGQYCNVIAYIKNGTAVKTTVEALKDVLHPKLQYFKDYFTVEGVTVCRLGICFVKECGQRDLQVLVDSPTSNTRDLLRVADKANADQYAMQFLHGLRFVCVVHIVMCHFYTCLSDSWCKFCTPLFFLIMCLYVSPRFVTGPDAKTGFQKLFDEVTTHWWHLLLQIRNFYEVTVWDVLVHTWYLSADFQLFLVALMTLVLLKGRKAALVVAFSVLSLLGCSVGTWIVAHHQLLPIIIFPGPNVTLMSRTQNLYYIRPYYHTVSYFSGCIAFLLAEDFRKKNISKGVQLAGWCVSLSCGLISVFGKLPWYRSPNPTSEMVTLFVAFFDRIVWSVFLVWITLACSSGRGVACKVASSVKLLDAEMRATTGVDRIASSELPNVLHGVPVLLVRKVLEEVRSVPGYLTPRSFTVTSQ